MQHAQPMDDRRLVKLSVAINNWCAELGVPATEENIGKALAMMGRSLTKFDFMRLYGMMFGVDPLTFMPKIDSPIFVHQRRSAKYWVPARSDPECVVARVSTLGSRTPNNIYEAMPNAVSLRLVKEHEEFIRKQKEHEEELLTNT